MKRQTQEFECGEEVLIVYGPYKGKFGTWEGLVLPPPDISAPSHAKIHRQDVTVDGISVLLKRFQITSARHIVERKVSNSNPKTYYEMLNLWDEAQYEISNS